MEAFDDSALIDGRLGAAHEVEVLLADQLRVDQHIVEDPQALLERLQIDLHFIPFAAKNSFSDHVRREFVDLRRFISVDLFELGELLV